MQPGLSVAPDFIFIVYRLRGVRVLRDGVADKRLVALAVGRVVLMGWLPHDYRQRGLRRNGPSRFLSRRRNGQRRGDEDAGNHVFHFSLFLTTGSKDA